VEEMMNNLNSVLLEGNLVRDPELVRFVGSESLLTKFSIASNRYYRNQKGESVEEVLFIPVNVWGRLAENCSTYLSKGREVRVVGRLRQERWTDKEGNNRDRFVVVADHVEFRGDRKKEDPVSLDEEVPFDQEIAF